MISWTSIVQFIVAALGFAIVALFFFGWWWRYRNETYPLTRPRKPGEMHVRPAYNFCGGGTQADPDTQPINALDQCCYVHDREYGDANISTGLADDRLLNCVDRVVETVDLTPNELIDAEMIRRGISTKEELTQVGILPDSAFR